MRSSPATTTHTLHVFVMRSDEGRGRGSIAGRGRCDPGFRLVARSDRDDRHITWMHGAASDSASSRGRLPTISPSKVIRGNQAEPAPAGRRAVRLGSNKGRSGSTRHDVVMVSGQSLRVDGRDDVGCSRSRPTASARAAIARRESTASPIRLHRPRKAHSDRELSFAQTIGLHHRLGGVAHAAAPNGTDRLWLGFRDASRTSARRASHSHRSTPTGLLSEVCPREEDAARAGSARGCCRNGRVDLTAWSGEAGA
jgi:hypothetical protein